MKIIADDSDDEEVSHPIVASGCTPALKKQKHEHGLVEVKTFKRPSDRMLCSSVANVPLTRYAMELMKTGIGLVHAPTYANTVHSSKLCVDVVSKEMMKKIDPDIHVKVPHIAASSIAARLCLNMRKRAGLKDDDIRITWNTCREWPEWSSFRLSGTGLVFASEFSEMYYNELENLLFALETLFVFDQK